MSTLKKPTRAVTFYACGHCSRTFSEKLDADKHCICKCGRIVDPETHRGYGTKAECGRCDLKSALLRGRARVRQRSDELKSAEDHVAELKKQYEAKKEASP